MSNGYQYATDDPSLVWAYPSIKARLTFKPAPPPTPMERLGRPQMVISLYGRLLLAGMPRTAQSVFAGSFSDDVMNELYNFYVGA